MKKPPQVYILILNWNGKKDTLECLFSLEKLKYSNYKIVLIDNASSDDSVATFQKTFPQHILLQNKRNEGFAEGNNIGIRYALDHGADFVFLLNNDTIVDPHLLDHLIEASHEKPNAAVLGAKVLRYDAKDILDHFGGKWNPHTCKFEEKAKNEKDSPSYEIILPAEYVCGCAFLISRKALETIGLLESQFFLFWEETDFCARCCKENLGVYLVGKAKVWHKISASFVGGKPHSHYYWWRNRLFWIKRNLSSQQQKEAAPLLRKEIFKEYRHAFLKGLQLFFLRPFKSKHWVIEKRTFFNRKRAGCRGIADYYFKRMDEGPKWLTKKTSKR